MCHRMSSCNSCYISYARIFTCRRYAVEESPMRDILLLVLEPLDTLVSLHMAERAVAHLCGMAGFAHLSRWQRITDFPHMRVCSAGMAFYAGDISTHNMVAMVYFNISRC